MLDPREQAKNGFGAFAARQAERRAGDDGRSADDALGGTAPPPTPVAPGATPRVPRPALDVSGPDEAPLRARVFAEGPGSESAEDLGYRAPLASLYERFDLMASGRMSGDRDDVHALILARLAENRRHAEGAGWTSLSLERDGGGGRLRLVGIAPSASARTVVPDWTAGVEAEALARRGDAARSTAALHVRRGMAARPPRRPGRDR